jgi:transcriptional regulator with XRE-family HTH domain
MRRLLARRERRGLTYGELAEETGVPAHTLSWWAWRLRREEREKIAFVELEVAEESGEAAIEVELASGHRLHVSRGFDEGTLRRVVAVLGSC